MQKLKTTLKAFPVITLVAIALCFVTGAVSERVFGVKLEDQASLGQVRTTILWLIDKLCSGAAWDWYFFKDVLALVQIVGSIIVLAPLVEETLFRWLLWRLPRPGLPAVSAVTSSILFSAAHYIQMPWPNNAFLALFFFGMAQCWLYARTDRLWCPILNHALFNAANMVLIFAFPD